MTRMANIMIGWANAIDAATLSGGSWHGSLPLAHVQTRALGRVARSTSLAAAATQLTATFTGTPPAVECIALVAHNLSSTAKWRITAVSVDGSTSASTGWLDIWPRLLPSEMDWEDARWWSGEPDAETVELYTPLAVWTGGADLWPANQHPLNPGRWRVEIDDAGNPDGHVQVGRVFLGRAFTPRRNYSRGESLGYESGTRVEESPLGVEFFERREPVRVMRFRLDHLNDDEALAVVLAMQRRLGVDGEVLVIPDRRNAVFEQQRRIYGRLRQLSPIEHPYLNTHSTAFEVREILA